KITHIWAEVLRRPAESISVDDNFFDLGGHSLMAIRLVNEIAKTTGVEIPLTTLFQGATVEHMANIILGKETITRTVIQQIQAGGNRAPFFAAVLAGVNSLGYVPLAKRLGSEQPFYTLQTPGPGPRAQRRPYTQKEYEQVAADYIKAMRSIQANGPYHIGGICEGARIAFEMARILESEGQEVALLAIIDTWVLENTQNRRLWKLYYYSVRLRQIASKSMKDIGPWALRALRNQFTRALGSKSAPPRSEWLDVYWPGQDFVAPRIHTKITLFKVPKQPYYYNRDPLMGWASRSTAGVDVHIIPNGRHRFLLREPYVRELAATLSRALDQLQPRVDHEQLANKAEVVGAS
ncbi:MAG TPA: phosphopantetheine-binding protein, partial [Terriglobales bacterium]